jgi:hypothetical protein
MSTEQELRLSEGTQLPEPSMVIDILLFMAIFVFLLCLHFANPIL